MAVVTALSGLPDVRLLRYNVKVQWAAQAGRQTGLMGSTTAANDGGGLSAAKES